MSRLLYNGNNNRLLTTGGNKLLVSQSKQPYMLDFMASGAYGSGTSILSGTDTTVAFLYRLEGNRSNSGTMILYHNSGQNFWQVTDSASFANFYVGENFRITASRSVVKGEIVHIVLTTNSISGSKVYMDGILVASSARVVNIPTGSKAITIGKAPSSSDWDLKGQLQDLRVYQRTLSAEEAVALSKGQSVSSDNLILWDNPLNSKSEFSLMSNAVKKLSIFPVRQRSGLRFPVSGIGEVIVPHTTNFNITQSITMESWICMHGSFNYGTIITKDTTYYFQIHGDNIPQFYAYGVTSSYQKAASPIKLGKWTHVAVTYDGSFIRFYIDGELNNEIAATGTIVTTTNNITLGAVGTTRPLRGASSNTRLWNKALSLTEIKANMYSYLPANTPNLIEQWKLNEGIGSIAYGTKGNNGTITGTTWTTPSLMNYVGKCLKIDGTTTMGVATIPNSGTFRTTSNFTVGFWFKYGSAPSTTRTILEKLSAFTIRVSPDGTISAARDGAIVNATILAPNTWGYVTFTVSAVNSYKCWLNGVAGSASTSGTPVQDDTKLITVGGTSPSPIAQWFDEITFWDRELTATEIADIMAKSPDRNANCVMNYGFESGGWDSSGYGRHMTIPATSIIEVTDNDKLLLNAPIN